MQDFKMFFPWTMENICLTVRDITVLVKKNQDKKVVIFNPEEHSTFNPELQNHREKIEQLCEENNVVLEFWLGDFGFDLEESKYIKFVNWPLFLLYSTCSTVGAIYQEEKYIDRLGVSLNNVAHDFRCEFIDVLAKYQLLDDMYYTWHNEFYPSGGYDFKWFTPKVVRLSEEEDLGFVEGAWDQYHVPKEYHQGLIHVINESTVDKLDISEKTWQAIAHKKPFIIAGIEGIHQVLVDLGFKLYTDLFDYEFDSDPSYSNRLESIAQQVKKHQGKNYQQLYESQKETIEFNYNKLMHMFENNVGVPEELYNYIGVEDYTSSPVYQSIQQHRASMEVK